MSDRIVEQLRDLYETVLAAGRAYVAGDVALAQELTSDVAIEARDVAADLARLDDTHEGSA